MSLQNAAVKESEKERKRRWDNSDRDQCTSKEAYYQLYLEARRGVWRWWLFRTSWQFFWSYI